MHHFKLRDYQQEIANKALSILKAKKIVYLNMEVRTGKTCTSLEVAKNYGAKKVLFLTKKKAIGSIESDYKSFGHSFEIQIINNESLHKVTDKDFDLLISDEHHRNGAYPKMNIATKFIKERFSHLPMIFLSGTICPESYSQIYHQFAVSDYSPFINYKSFYKWVLDFVTIKKKYVSYGVLHDYSDANIELIQKYINPYIISFTQKQAGFTTEVKENVLTVKMKQQTYDLINKLKKDLVIEGKQEVILADTGVKLMSKVHQLYSGTVKFESGNSMIIDDSKAEFIKERFSGVKIGIFYKFKEEYNLLKKVFGENLCNTVEEFDSTDKNIALQIVSGREGISLRNAKYLIYLNIDFSATSYWQSRDRLSTMERLKNDVFWIFAENGIEFYIYKAVMNKKDFTLQFFKEYVRKQDTS
jgi:hypothetical protein